MLLNCETWNHISNLFIYFLQSLYIRSHWCYNRDWCQGWAFFTFAFSSSFFLWFGVTGDFMISLKTELNNFQGWVHSENMGWTSSMTPRFNFFLWIESNRRFLEGFDVGPASKIGLLPTTSKYTEICRKKKICFFRALNLRHWVWIYENRFLMLKICYSQQLQNILRSAEKKDMLLPSFELETWSVNLWEPIFKINK